jgi:hypothetical protein
MAGSALSTKININCGVSSPASATNGTSSNSTRPTWVTRRAPWRSVTVGSSSAAGRRLTSQMAYRMPRRLVVAPSWVNRPATTADHAPLPRLNTKMAISTASKSRLTGADRRGVRCGRIDGRASYATLLPQKKEC